MRRWAPLGRISNSFGWQECVVRISMPTWLFLKSYCLLVRVDQLHVCRNWQMICLSETELLSHHQKVYLIREFGSDLQILQIIILQILFDEIGPKE